MDNMDVDDNDTRAGLTIQDLPNELLSEILKWFTGFNREDHCELENVLRVCQRWYDIVDGWIGRYVTCSDPMLIHPSNPDLTKEGLELISEIGVRLFEIRENRSRNLLEPPSSSLPSFKRPYLLRFLDISCSIHPDLFSNLVKDTVNLCGLRISQAALSQLQNSDLKQASLKFPRLKILCLDTSRGSDGEDPRAVALASLPNILTVIGENKFPNLASFQLNFPVRTFDDLETMKILIPFIQGHRVLANLSVKMNFPNERIPVDKIIYQDELKRIMEVINPQKYFISLKTLRLCSRTVNRHARIGDYPHLDVWNEFLLKLMPQTLTDLCLEIGLISNELMRTICTEHRSTLGKLKVDQRQSDFQFGGPADPQLDCNAMSPLQCLRELELEMHYRHEIIGIRHLPASLVHINLTGKMRSEEFHHLLLHLPNLRRLSYTNYCNRFNNDENEGYAVRVDTLRQFVEDRKVEYLDLYDDVMGRNFPEGGIPNGDPENPKMLSCYTDNCLAWKLNRRGYYFNLFIAHENTVDPASEDD